MRQRFGFAAVLVLLGALAASPVQGRSKSKSYSIPRLEIQARLGADGRMRVRESRSYDFDGRFSYAYITLPKDDRYQFGDFAVAEGPVVYEASTEDSPGTFRVTDDGDALEIRWFFRAKNEVRTFDFSYTVQGAVHRFEDAAVLYYRFVGPGWRVSSRNVTLRVVPPESPLAEAPSCWVHGPLWFESGVRYDGVIDVSLDRLKKKEILELRALYAPEAFSQIWLEAGNIRESVERDEAVLAQNLEARRDRSIARAAALKERQQWGKWLLLGLVAAGLWGWWTLRARYRHVPHVAPVEPMRYGPPESTPPALVAYLVNAKQITGQALVATLFDLARRGLLVLEETDAQATPAQRRRHPSAQWRLNRDAQSQVRLTEYEGRLLELLFGEMAGGSDVLTLEQFKKKQSKMTRFFPKWTKTVKEEAEKRDWFDRQSEKGMYWAMGLGGFIMLLTVPGALLFGLYGLILLGGGLLVLLLSLAIPQRTDEGERLYREWKAYRKFLSKATRDATLRAQGLSYLVEHLIYGPALGLMPQTLQKIVAWMPADEAATLMPWLKLPEGLDMQTTFVPVMMAVMASTSSTVAAGTGVAAGGAGGAGGGGAG